MTDKTKMPTAIKQFISVKTDNHSMRRKAALTAVVAVFLFVLPLTGVFLYTRGRASAAASSTLNFQGRLLDSTGSTVADGSYNIQFNIYSVPAAGTTQWTESYLVNGGQGVTIKNGYFSVNLGSLTSFPSNIAWDQEQWLGMTVRGTGSCAFGACTPADAEMTPRFKLTSVPFAFRAAKLMDSTNTNAFTADDLIQKAPGTPQVIASALAAIRLNQTSTGGLLQLQNTGVDKFTVDNNGNTDTAGSLTVSGGTATLGTGSQAGSLVISDGSTNTVTLTASGVGSNYSLTLPTNAPTTDQCLRTNTATASQLEFGNCGSHKVQQSYNTYSINQAANATTAQNYLLPTTATAFSIALAGTNEVKMTRAGSFRSCSIFDSAVVTAGSVSVRFRKNGVNTSAVNYCTLDTTNTRSNTQDIDPGIETFAAGDTIGIALVSAGLAPITNEHWVSFTVEFGTGSDSGIYKLQDAYNNSGAQELVLDSTRGGMTIQDNATPIAGNLLEIQNNAGSTNYFTVSATGITSANALTVTAGGIAVTGNSTINGTLSSLTGLSLASGNITQTGAGSLSTGTGTVSLNGNTTVAAASSFTAAGVANLNGNTTIGDAITDRLTITSQLLGTNALVFQGLTDNAFTTTFAITDPTANRTITFPDASGTVQLAPATGSYLLQAPTTTAANTITPTINGVVGLSVNATSGTAAAALIVNQSQAANGVQISSTDTLGTQASGLSVSRNGVGGTTTSLLSLANTAGTVTNGILFTGVVGTDITSAAARSLTVVTGTTGGLNLDTGTTGAITIGTNANAKAITIGNNTTTSGLTLVAGSNNINLNAATIATNQAAVTLLNTTATTVNAFGAATTLNIGAAAGTTTVAGGFTTAGPTQLNGNTTIGNAAADRLTVTSQLLGTNALVFQGVTDNAFTTTFAITDPTGNNTITFPNASGTVQLAPASGTYISQVPISTAANTITPTAASVVGLTVNATSGTATTATIINQSQAADGLQVTTTNAAGTQTNGVLITRNGAGTTTNLLNLTNTAGTTTNGLVFNGTITNDITTAAARALNIVSGTTGIVTLDSGTTGNINIGTNANAKTVTIGNNTLASAVTIIGGTGSINLNAPAITTNQATLTLFNTTATTINAFGASTALSFGAVAGTSTANGALTVAGNANLNGNTTIGNATTDRITITSQILNANALVFQGATDNAFTTTFTVTDPTANQTITIPNESGTLTLIAPAAAQADASSNSSLFINKTGAAGNILTLQKNAAGVFTVGNSGATTISNTSTAALDIKNAGGTSYFTIDTTNSLVQVGNATADATGVVLINDTKNTTADPTGLSAVIGAQYYNSFWQQYRCYRDGIWETCGTNPIDRAFAIEDEFISGTSGTTCTTTNATVGGQNWACFVSGTNTTDYNVGAILPTANRPGIMRITTGNANGNGMTSALAGNNSGSMVISPLNRVLATVGQGATITNNILRVGLHAETTTNARPTTGVWWEADSSTNANWQYCYGDGAAAQCAASGQAIAASTLYSLDIQVTTTGAGTSAATFRINGTAFTVTAVTISTAARVNPAISCFNSVAANRECFVDYYQLSGVATARR